VYTGKLVRLRAFEREDAERYRAWVNDAEIAQFVDRAKPVTRIEHERWYEALVRSDRTAVFAVEPRRGGRLIGLAWLFGIDWRHRRAEVRILIGDRRSWNSGRGTDAVRTLTRVAFGPLNLEKLYADVLAFNARALAAFERAGFLREGLLRGDRAVLGRRLDVVRLGLLRGEGKAS
jgi:RimJ/RimL family protein N-acetyltransferase